MPTEKSCRDSLFGLLKATAPLSDTDKHLIRKELKNTSQLIAYFLWRSTSISTDKIETIFNNLIDLDAFDKITLNQTFSQKFLDRQQVYSVSYLLLSSAEGRKILNENQSLCDLIGENLSENLLKQFVHKDTHEGTLYYLLTSEVGNKILSEYSSLRDKIDPSVLAKQIVDGPEKGVSFGDLYKRIFPDPPEKKFST
ncbi:hypothetical protein [Rickettsiella endosymbiont of Aleochara curtula]|uniref:hypothetical protein n=1 Tax=Rickettsiella endosymbiont of Aleochara curtula TaxID=3077936 RepID=UPI00313C7906